jgi:hypothetical protein
MGFTGLDCAEGSTFHKNVQVLLIAVLRNGRSFQTNHLRLTENEVSIYVCGHILKCSSYRVQIYKLSLT